MFAKCRSVSVSVVGKPKISKKNLAKLIRQYPILVKEDKEIYYPYGNEKIYVLFYKTDPEECEISKETEINITFGGNPNIDAHYIESLFERAGCEELADYGEDGVFMECDNKTINIKNYADGVYISYVNI